MRGFRFGSTIVVLTIGVRLRVGHLRQHRAIAVVRQEPRRLSTGHPAGVVGLGGRLERPADGLEAPVADALRPAVPVDIRGRRQLLAERALEACLLQHLPQRALLVGLARLALALRERPVVVLRTVDHEHLDPRVALARGHASRGSDDVVDRGFHDTSVVATEGRGDGLRFR